MLLIDSLELTLVLVLEVALVLVMKLVVSLALVLMMAKATGNIIDGTTDNVGFVLLISDLGLTLLLALVRLMVMFLEVALIVVLVIAEVMFLEVALVLALVVALALVLMMSNPIGDFIGDAIDNVGSMLIMTALGVTVLLVVIVGRFSVNDVSGLIVLIVAVVGVVRAKSGEQVVVSGGLVEEGVLGGSSVALGNLLGTGRGSVGIRNEVVSGRRHFHSIRLNQGRVPVGLGVGWGIHLLEGEQVFLDNRHLLNMSDCRLLVATLDH